MIQMDRSKLCGGVVAAMILCATACSAYPQQQHEQHEQTSTEPVEQVPQRPTTLKNGYHPGLFPFNKGEPFVMDPNLSSVTGFNTKPPPQPNDPQRADDEYYDYDAKLEEVPYDYKGDPIDRKDVLEPKLPRPNDIKPAGNKNKLPPADIYQFLNLPVKYSSSDYKFPLMSSSYANTKVQGSGSSSLLSNHKMPSTVQPSSAAVSSTATPTTLWYNPVKTTAFKPMTTTTTTATTTTITTTPTTTTFLPTTTTTTSRPTTIISTSRPTTTTTTANPPSQQEYEDDYYDYFHSQDPVPETPSTARPSTTTIIVHRNQPPSVVTPEPVTTTTTTTSTTTPKSTTTTTTVTAPTEKQPQYYTNPAPVTNKTTTARPEIDSKLDGTSFADYDMIKKEQPAQKYGQNFKHPTAGYPFDDKTYPLITNGKVPMTFTAHVSSGISLNQKEHGSPSSAAAADHPKPSTVVSEPVYSSRPQPQPDGQRDSMKPVQEPMYDDSSSRLPPRPVQESVYDDDGSRLPSAGKPSPPEPSASASATTYSQKPRPPKPAGTDQFETVYYKVRPDGYPQQFPGRPVASPPTQQSRPYQPEQPVQTRLPPPPQTADSVRKPTVNGAEFQAPQPQGRPPQQQQPYRHPAVPSEGYTTKNKAQYVPVQSQPDTSRFKPPKHVINHFIKTLPNDDNKSYALQTSFSIGMDGERTADTRPAQGIGQVLMVEDGGGPAETAVVDQTIQPPTKPKPTTSVPLVSPPRLVQKPLLQSYPRPQWESVPKPPQYYPAPKRDNVPPPPPPPPQRTNLPNILPQFRPNAKVDTPPSHSGTVERVQMPTDHLRPPPLPKPQFLKLDRNDDNADDEILDIPEKETRILQRTGPQPAKVTTLQMIQHGPPSKTRDDDQEKRPVHVVYAANAPPKAADKLPDDSAMLDVNDRSDVPILKTKTVNYGKPVKTDFPYQIVKPEENQNASSLEYQAYSPTKAADTIKPSHEQDLVPNLQDYVPVTTRDSASNNNAVPQKTIAATLKTSEDNHKMTAVDDGHHKPQLQNFQIPFQPSLKLPENSNGWSVVRKPPTDNASDRMDETTGDVAASTEKFDPDNFKPQLVGGFLPISSPLEEDKDEKTVEQSERAKKSLKD